MAYTPTLWAKGDKVTSEKLNKIEQGIVDKVDKETGKTLSTNDFTDAYKTKLDGIEANADKTTIDATLTNSGAAADAKATGDAIQNIENDLDGKVATIESNLDEKVENLKSLVGTPLKATTASAMTDTSKIYVYTGNESGYTNGDWYYHDGSAWVDGGTYNSVAVEVDKTLTFDGMPADAKVTGDEIGQLKSGLDYIAPIVAPVKTNTKLENGTISNPNNANAVRTANFIECKKGDVVTFYPVRPNMNGYSYLYGYRVYDANGNTVVNVSDVIADGNVVTITNQNAASIKFFIVESDGTNMNPLRADTYGYVPYAIVVNGTSIQEHIDKIEDNLNYVISKNEILNNASWYQGGIDQGVDTNSSIRIKTGYFDVGYVCELDITITNGYAYALNYYDINKNWISSDNSWQYSNAKYVKSDYPTGTGYIRVVLRKGTNTSIVPTACANISGIASIVAQQGIEYVIDKIDSLDIVSDNETAHYNDLLSQARFSPRPNPDLPHTANVLTLLHFSDVHDNLVAMEKALDIYSTYSSKIDDMIHTGDVVRGNWSDGLTNWIDSGCAESVISVIGNHDSEENYILGTAGKETVYSGMLAPYIENWDVVQPSGVNDPASNHYCACYYYKDYADQHMRLIVLDTNWWDSYQKDWLADVLDDALTNEYAIILACHSPRFVTGITDANFCSYTEPNINEPASFSNISNDWLDPVDDFINDGGEVICMLAGHNHRDHIGYLTNYPNVLCITADKASVARTMDTERVTGENNATAFNAITFNATDKWIKIVRFGAEIDGQMRGKHVFCYDYANKKIVSQW